MANSAPRESQSVETAAIRAAQHGDHAAFDRLIAPHRRALMSHCYRMVASVYDAEDLVQETFLRAWRKLSTFEARAAFGSWLYRIATNVCLDFLDHRRRRILPPATWPSADPTVAASAHIPLDEALWISPYPDGLLDDDGNPEVRYRHRESVRLAFVVALQSLPPRQRAILILRDVLEWEAQEVASLLETTVASVNSAVQRARATLRKRSAPGVYGDGVDDGGVDEALLDRYLRAWEEADVDGLVAILTEDATMIMPPYAEWYRGRASIITFLAGSVFGGAHPRVLRLLRTWANAQPAFALYQWDEEHQRYLPLSLQVLTVHGSRVADISGFVDPRLFTYFGLPSSLRPDERAGASLR